MLFSTEQNDNHPMTGSFPITIISGGQTGADQAALDAAIFLRIPHGGWICSGRKTEAGPLPDRYLLKELESPRYRDRTEKNILAADGTLIVSFGPPSGGTALTEALSVRHDRPFLRLDLDVITETQAAAALLSWLQEHKIRILNVAGPRASNEPRIHEAVYSILTNLAWEELRP